MRWIYLVFLILIGCQHSRENMDSFTPTQFQQIKTLDSVSGNRVAVFDLDNTLILGDIGDAALYWMTYYQWFDESIFANAEITQHLTKYETQKLFRAYKRAKNTSNEKIKNEFLFSFFETYKKLCDSHSEAYCYKWSAQLFSGLTPERARQIARSVLLKEENPAKDYHIIGTNSTLPSGIKINPPMKNLVGWLKEKNYDIFVISASMNILVEEAILHFYPEILRENIYGTTLSRKNNELTSNVNQYPLRAGKSLIVEENLKDFPNIVVGDSVNDWEMLLTAKNIRMVLKRDPRLLNQIKDLNEDLEKSKWLILD